MESVGLGLLARVAGVLQVAFSAALLLKLVHAAHIDTLTHRFGLGSTGAYNEVGAPLDDTLWLLAHRVAGDVLLLLL